MTETDADGDRDVTTLAEEIRLLVDLVVERAAPWLDGVAAAGHGAPAKDGAAAQESGTEHADREGDTSGDTGCGWCPLCALVAIARGERPEFAVRVLEQAAQLIALLRAVLADRWAPDEGVHMPGYQPPPRPEPAGSRVQHIPVRRRWGGAGTDGER